MSFFDVSSIDASAERYIRILKLAAQARPRDADCTLLLCVATRIFAGHVDWLRECVEPRGAKLHGEGFTALHRLWNDPFVDQHGPWGNIPSQISWVSGVDKSELRRGPDWAEGLFRSSAKGVCPLQKWGEVAGHLRNALSHGAVRWVRDGRPHQEAVDSGGASPAFVAPRRSPSIGGIVLLSEEQRDGPTVRACRISVADFEDLLFRWLRAIKDSGIRASADEVAAALRQAS